MQVVLKSAPCPASSSSYRSRIAIYLGSVFCQSDTAVLCSSLSLIVGVLVFLPVVFSEKNHYDDYQKKWSQQQA